MLCIHEVTPIVPTYLGIVPPAAEAQGNALEAKNSSILYILHQLLKATPSQIDKYLIWAFKTVMSHSSLNSNRNKRRLFQSMFPDSDVAKQYQMKASVSRLLCCDLQLIVYHCNADKTNGCNSSFLE